MSFNPHCNGSFIFFAVKYKAICWAWSDIIFIITETRLDSIHAILMDLSCQPSEQKKFCFSPPVLFHSNWSFLTQILRVCEPFIFRLSLAYLPSCPCLNQQQVKWFCLQTIPHRCSPLHSHSLKSKAPTFLPWSVVASSALVLPLN